MIYLKINAWSAIAGLEDITTLNTNTYFQNSPLTKKDCT